MDGYSAVDAVLKASPTRLRPILMTAMTTILGQMPLIFSNGDNLCIWYLIQYQKELIRNLERKKD